MPVTFTSPGRGVHLGRLQVTSNAENLPQLTVELVGPGAGDHVPDAADIEVFEAQSTLTPMPGIDVDVGLVRFYNLGRATLEVTSYGIDDSDSFTFLAGTAQPSVACEASGTCAAETGCCGDLACIEQQCEAVRLLSGDFVLLGVTWSASAVAGTHSSEVRIHSSDEDTPVAVVTVSGEL